MRRLLVLAFLVTACQPTTATPNSAPAITPAPTAQPTPAPTPTPTAAPTPTALLTLKGNGIKNSKTFTASGDSVDVAYNFDCKGFGSQGNFIAHLVDASGSADSIANALASKGSDSTTVYLSGTEGPYHVEVISECSWSLTVSGTP